MRWIGIKPEEFDGAPNEKLLAGIAVTADYDGSAMKSIELSDGVGNRLRISRGDWQQLDCYRPAPPPMVKRYRLSGTAGPALHVNEVYDSEAKAEERKREIEFAMSDCKLVINNFEEVADGQGE